jgi:anti-anti-sigma factor
MNKGGTIDIDPGGCARLSGDLTFATSRDLYRDMEQALERGADIVELDLSDVTTLDSAGLALLLEWQASRRRMGDRLAIRNPPAGLLRLARLCEADEWLAGKAASTDSTA